MPFALAWADQDPAFALCLLVRMCHRSADAELVALRVEHHDVAEEISVVLLADPRRPGVDELRSLGPDEALAFSPVQGGSPAGRMSMCIRFFEVFGSGTWRKPIAGPKASGSTIDAPNSSS